VPREQATPMGNEYGIMHSETILLVEDETSLRSVMRLFLEHSGYGVMDADNGVDALFLSANHKGPIHLLLTDVEMSPMSGPELAEQMLLDRPETHVLFMSGNRQPEDLFNDLCLLNAKFLGKPFNPAMLKDSVRQVLGAIP
jgi:two-component system, cell cycle sensor histidine kinase and response regulator CckA